MTHASRSAVPLPFVEEHALAHRNGGDPTCSAAVGCKIRLRLKRPCHNVTLIWIGATARRAVLSTLRLTIFCDNNLIGCKNEGMSFMAPYQASYPPYNLSQLCILVSYLLPYSLQLLFHGRHAYPLLKTELIIEPQRETQVTGGAKMLT